MRQGEEAIFGNRQIEGQVVVGGGGGEAEEERRSSK